MIEIRPAHPEELPRIKELWGLAFGDDGAFIDRFYALAGGETLLLFEEGTAWAMTVLLPVTLALAEGGMASGAYVYALCTHPEARSRGYGQFLLKYVDFYLREKGVQCVLTVPAEESLHRFFAKAGFAEAFGLRVERPEPAALPEPEPGDRLEPLDPGGYNRLREKHLAGEAHVAYGGELLAVQDFLGGGHGLWQITAAGQTGLCAVEPESGLAKEFLLPGELWLRGCALLARQWPGRRWELRGPAGPEKEMQKFGMLKWLTLPPAGAEVGYMGLAFD